MFRCTAEILGAQLKNLGAQSVSHKYLEHLLQKNTNLNAPKRSTLASCCNMGLF